MRPAPRKTPHAHRRKRESCRHRPHGRRGPHIEITRAKTRRFDARPRRLASPLPRFTALQGERHPGSALWTSLIAVLAFPLTTERFEVSPLAPADAARFTEYRPDPGTARFQSWTPAWSQADTATLIGAQPRGLRSQSGAWLQIAVRDRTSGALVGDVAVHALIDQPHTYELGVTIAPAHRGTGASTEALEALIDALFHRQHSHRLLAFTDTRNKPARRLFRRLGFRHEGCAVQADWFKGEWSSLDSWALLRSEHRPYVLR